MSRAALLALALALAPSSAMADEARQAGDAAPVAPEASLNPLAALEKAALEAFRETPLFTPSRRRPAPPPAPVAEAPPPPPPPVEEAPPEPPSIKLSGVIQGPEGAIAFVRNEADGGRVEQLRLGDQIGGWLVTDIDGGSLKLTLDDREQDYRLFERREAASAGNVEEPDDSAARASETRGRSRGDPSIDDDNVEEDEPPRRRTQRPRTQNDNNRRPMSPEGQ